MIRFNPPANAEAVQAFSGRLPDDYLQFLLKSDGGEGSLNEETYGILWKVSELETFNREYEVEEYASGLFLFGANGGGEAYAFDRTRDESPVILVPFIGMDHSAKTRIGDTFTVFIKEHSQQGTANIRPANLQQHLGKELFFVHPIVLGGDPKDSKNVILLDRPEHIDAVRYWNRVVRDVRGKQSRERNAN